MVLQAGSCYEDCPLESVFRNSVWVCDMCASWKVGVPLGDGGSWIRPLRAAEAPSGEPQFQGLRGSAS